MLSTVVIAFATPTTSASSREPPFSIEFIKLDIALDVGLLNDRKKYLYISHIL